MWACCNIFSKYGTKRCSLIWKHIENENTEKGNSKIYIFILNLQNCLLIFEEGIRSLEKYELIALELFSIICRLLNSHGKKLLVFRGKKLLQNSKKKKKKEAVKGSQNKQEFFIFFAKTPTSFHKFKLCM